MRRTILSTIGLLFIALFVSACFFLAGPEGEVKVLQQSPLPTATSGGPTPLPTPEFCISATHDCVLLEFLGYVQNGDGTTTLNYRITNNCVDEVEYFAIETGLWSRDTPADGSSYSGDLGAHAVSWVDEQQGIPTQGLRFDSQTTGFKDGAAELYTFTVRDFTPRSPNTGRVVVGDRELAFRMMLLDPACEIGVNPTPRPTPTAPFSPLPTPTPVPVGYTLPTEPIVPECVFEPPAGGLPPDEPVIPLSAYSFSEPTLVLTHTAPIGIEQWLPDSETLLVTRHTDKGNKLESLNPTTSEITVLLEPNRAIDSPRWLSEESTIAWSELGAENREEGYWVRSFNPESERKLSIGSGTEHDVSPNGKEFVFLSPPGGSQPFIWNQETKTLRALPVDLNNWRYKDGSIYPLRSFNVNWRPTSTEILFWDGTWAFLYSLTNNSGCELKMDSLSPGYPAIDEAKWSPNGRYLLVNAAQTAAPAVQRPVRTLLLDLYTGDITHYGESSLGDNFSWGPDNQTISMTGYTGTISGGVNLPGIYLLNVHSGTYEQILPRLDLAFVNPIWSSDGKRLAFYGQTLPLDAFNFDDYRAYISQVSLSQ